MDGWGLRCKLNIMSDLSSLLMSFPCFKLVLGGLIELYSMHGLFLSLVGELSSEASIFRMLFLLLLRLRLLFRFSCVVW